MRGRAVRPMLFLLLAGLIGTGGCTSVCDYVRNGFKVGPNYGKPPAPVSSEWIDAADMRVRKESGDLSKWWTVFNDPILNALVCDAYQQNISLREAGFRVLRSRAELGIAVGELFPQQQAMGGSFTQYALSKEVANRQFIADRWYPQWNYGFSLAWELDFWGRFRRSIEAARDTLNASIEDYDDVLVTLLGDVATQYVTLRTVEKQIVLAKANIGLQRETLILAQARFKGGQATELDVDQAQSTLSQTEALVPQLEVQLRQANNRLCILMGMPPAELKERLGPGAIPTAPPDVVVGIPAELLSRRPDVRRDERQAAAQSARVGVATANLYPMISITGNIGFTAEQFAHLFSERAFSGSVGPSFQWNILNYGRLVNGIRREEAIFQELVARYQSTVLRAGEETENGIIFFLRSQERVRYLTESVVAAEKAVRIALAQYKGGTVDFNRVALLEQNLVQQQNLLAQAQGDVALGLIQVYRALGGGWEIRYTGCPTPQTAASEGEAPAPPRVMPPEVPLPAPKPKPDLVPASMPGANGTEDLR